METVHVALQDMPEVSLGGRWCFITFVDEATRMVWVYVLKSRDDMLSALQRFVALVETQTSSRVQCLHTSNYGDVLFA